MTPEYGKGTKYRIRADIAECIEAEIFQRDKGLEYAATLNAMGELRAYIMTPKGAVFLNENDLIITYPSGERIVCNSSLFEKIYEKVKE